LTLVYLYVYSRKEKNLKAKQLYLGLLESFNRTDIVLGSTEPANYAGSYTAVFKEIVDTEISMYRSYRTVTIDTITIAPRTKITTAMQMLWLLKLTGSQEQEGGLRN
jgi:hypothetical protein